MAATRTARTAPQETNRILPEDRGVHEWYRFVLSYPPHLVRDYIERFRLGAAYSCVGPVLWDGDDPGRMQEARLALGRDRGQRDGPLRQPRETRLGGPSAGVAGRGVRPSASRPCRSTGPGAAGRMGPAILEKDHAYRRRGDGPVADFAGGACLAVTGPFDQSRPLAPDAGVAGLDPGPESAASARSPVAGVGQVRRVLDQQSALWPRGRRHGAEHDAPVVAAWQAEARRMATDLQAVRSRRQAPAVVHQGDSRTLEPFLEQPARWTP